MGKSSRLYIKSVYDIKSVPQRRNLWSYKSIEACIDVNTANIAEGSGKNKNSEVAHFLNIALGSANESEYFLLLAKDLGYVFEVAYQELFIKVNEIKAMLIALIQKVRQPST